MKKIPFWKHQLIFTVGVSLVITVPKVENQCQSQNNLIKGKFQSETVVEKDGSDEVYLIGQNDLDKKQDNYKNKHW